jgi:GT2 family glycosyltransferase
VAAQGDLIAYLDSDNTWRPDYLRAMTGFFQTHSDADAAYGGQYLYRGCESEPFAVRFGSYNPSLLRNRNYIDLNCLVHRREILKTIGGGFCKELKRWVDWELILRISRTGKIYSVPILQSNYFLDKAENTITATEEMKPARDHILAKLGYGGQKAIKGSEDQLIRKVAVVIVGDEDQVSLGKCIESLEENSVNPLIEVFVVPDSSDPESLRVNTIATEPGCDPIHAINQALHVADPESDVLILNRNAALTQGALPALQKAAYTCESITMVAPQQVLPGGEPSINSHVPYAFNDVPCDVTLSNHHKNIESLPLFHSGGVIDLNFASFFCLYIKREIWDECSILGNEKGGDGQTDRIMCDFVRHVLGKRIVYTPEAVVFRR